MHDLEIANLSVAKLEEDKILCLYGHSIERQWMSETDEKGMMLQSRNNGSLTPYSDVGRFDDQAKTSHLFSHKP